MASNEFRLPASLEAARIKTLPPAAFYMPDFISKDEEQTILDKIASAPKPRWKQLTHRRLQTWPSDLVQNKLLEAPLPSWLESPIVARLLSIPVTSNNAGLLFGESPHQRPNHVLDGATYWPVVCTVSLGSTLSLDIYESKQAGGLDSNPTWKILQEPRSLLITTESLYTDYLHGIADVEHDIDLSPETISNWSLLRDQQPFVDGINMRQVRTSLTYRDVLQVSKIGHKLGKFLGH